MKIRIRIKWKIGSRSVSKWRAALGWQDGTGSRFASRWCGSATAVMSWRAASQQVRHVLPVSCHVVILSWLVGLSASWPCPTCVLSYCCPVLESRFVSKLACPTCVLSWSCPVLEGRLVSKLSVSSLEGSAIASIKRVPSWPPRHFWLRLIWKLQSWTIVYLQYNRRLIMIGWNMFDVYGKFII